MQDEPTAAAVGSLARPYPSPMAHSEIHTDPPPPSLSDPHLPSHHTRPYDGEHNYNAHGDEDKKFTTAAMSARTQEAWKNLTLSEISGSLGDMGTLLPLLVALTKTGQISLPASLIFGGLYNIITGFVFGIPMCVQPMKSISAIALATQMPQSQIVAAGFSVSAIILILGLTRTITLLNTLIPLSIVRGIQLGTGLTLITNGVNTILKSNAWEFANWAWLDNFFLAILAFGACVWNWNARRNPSAVLLFLVGIAIAAVKLHAIDKTTPPPSFGFPDLTPHVPTATDFKTGFLTAGLGQLPLTLLNSVIAVSKLADDLFPTLRKSRNQPVAPITHVATCVGLMNILGTWFGSIPFCHGSGGLAAQHRFGARTASSIYFLGVLKIVAGGLFGASLSGLFARVPNSVLGVMLVGAGAGLVGVTRDMGGVEPYMVSEMRDQGNPPSSATQTEHAHARENAHTTMILTGCATSFFKNDGVGFLVGVAVACLFWARACLDHSEAHGGKANALRRGLRERWTEVRVGWTGEWGSERKEAARGSARTV
ncbi:uncharacterized protein EV422DRAFT_112859 [Fimicolochytrium jonesii]|uniref:uncharacterized protein n=1 Tax=Fimicolochytrium jonesii TaxID=1396493 RepID=UPI0022FE9757|nr:uncharacterized protein EV422DRAFT_112859 [Fimicolochytrium jonesii]KAI8819441.1 hypothetical protein EV422DRAFT_112859 [Fimicolochytrium jonesii]